MFGSELGFSKFERFLQQGHCQVQLSCSKICTCQTVHVDESAGMFGVEFGFLYLQGLLEDWQCQIQFTSILIYPSKIVQTR